MSRSILVVSGLVQESRIAAGPNLRPVVSGGSRAVLEQGLRSLDPSQIAAVVSFGIAGALEPGFRVGEVVLADGVQDAAERFEASTALRDGWMRHLRDIGGVSRQGSIAGVDRPLLTPGDKIDLRQRTGAAAVDMESHLAAAFAARHGLPFGAIRVISDGADRALPPVAGTAMRPDGSVDVLGVMRSLARDPGQIPGLIATARDAAVAFRSLRRVRSLLGLSGGLLGLDL